MPLNPDSQLGWYTSRRLPHFDAPHTFQFISFRLSDSLPAAVLHELKSETDLLRISQQSPALRARMEAYLDRGYGSCVLARPEMAAQLKQAFSYYERQRYELLAWCIMPNHVHVLIKPTTSLPRIVQSWKTWTARWAYQHAAELRLEVPEGGLWMRGYWDRYVRDEKHLHVAIRYIHQNPVKAGLCSRPQDWPWSSAPAEE